MTSSGGCNLPSAAQYSQAGLHSRYMLSQHRRSDALSVSFCRKAGLIYLDPRSPRQGAPVFSVSTMHSGRMPQTHNQRPGCKHSCSAERACASLAVLHWFKCTQTHRVMEWQGTLPVQQ